MEVTILLHEKIKLIRTSKNLTQAEFSKILGISQGKVSELEKGINKPSFDTLKSMYDKLSVSIDMLMNENPKKDISSDSNSTPEKLTDYEKNILNLLSQLPDREKYKLEGMLEYKVSELAEDKAKNIFFLYYLMSCFFCFFRVNFLIVHTLNIT